jgi:ribonuclease HI
MMSEKTQRKLAAYFDGACEPVNPGGTASYGAVAFIDGKRVWECSKIVCPPRGDEHKTSNNLAEYAGFVAVLEWLLELQLDNEETTIHGDSMLVIEQMSGRWRIKNGIYVETAMNAKELLAKFRRQPFLAWIPRELNMIADDLSKAELEKAGIKLRLQSR